MMDVIKEVVEEEKKYFENYKEYARKIKEIAIRELKDAKVLVFGSVIEGKHTPSSDIDILIVSKNLPKSSENRGKIRAKILKEIGVTTPFEIHFADLNGFEWYKKFIKKFEEV